MSLAPPAADDITDFNCLDLCRCSLSPYGRLTDSDCRRTLGGVVEMCSESEDEVQAYRPRESSVEMNVRDATGRFAPGRRET